MKNFNFSLSNSSSCLGNGSGMTRVCFDNDSGLASGHKKKIINREADTIKGQEIWNSRQKI